MKAARCGARPWLRPEAVPSVHRTLLNECLRRCQAFMTMDRRLPPCDCRHVFIRSGCLILFMEGETREITTLDEFRKVRLDDIGFLVIVDTARSAIIHEPNSECISAEKFKERVLLNERHTGKYFWVRNISVAVGQYGASPCKKCKPGRPRKDDRTNFESDWQSSRNRSPLNKGYGRRAL